MRCLSGSPFRLLRGTAAMAAMLILTSTAAYAEKACFRFENDDPPIVTVGSFFSGLVRVIIWPITQCRLPSSGLFPPPPAPPPPPPPPPPVSVMTAPVVAPAPAPATDVPAPTTDLPAPKPTDAPPPSQNQQNSPSPEVQPQSGTSD